MKKFIFLMSLFFLMVANAFSQVSVDVRTSYSYSLDSNIQSGAMVTGTSKNKFNVNDVYVNYSSDWSSDFQGSASVNYNETNKLNLHTAQIGYNFGISQNLFGTVSMGRMENNFYSYSERQWQNPELSSSISRKFNILPYTGDGAELMLKSTQGFVSVMVSNGVSDSVKSLSAMVGVNPLKQFSVAGLYFKDDNNTVFGGDITVNLKNKKTGSLVVGGEVLATNNSVTKGLTFSVFGEVFPKFSKNFSVVARYDNSKPDNNTDSRYEWLLAGVSYNPVSFVKAGVNFRTMLATGTSRHNEVVFNARMIF